MSPTPPPPGTRTSSGPTARPGRPSRWWGVTGGIVAVLVAIVVIVLFANPADSPDRITATTVAYKVESDSLVTVGFDVTRPPGQPVTCTITAQDRTFGAVGSVQLIIPTGGERTTHHVVTVRTASRAVTGNVTDCVRTP